jgi:hypothetical protein
MQVSNGAQQFEITIKILKNNPSFGWPIKIPKLPSVFHLFY